jgi:hypothetical protein
MGGETETTTPLSHPNSILRSKNNFTAAAFKQPKK